MPMRCCFGRAISAKVVLALFLGNKDGDETTVIAQGETQTRRGWEADEPI